MYPPDSQERFWAKVNKGATCWEWTGTTAGRGYGSLTIRQRTKYAHRVSYELCVGPIPDGLEIDHLCKNILCVNPDHLEAVTHWENNRRSGSISARQMRQTHCKRGHEFTPENTYIQPPNMRSCKTCRIACYRKWNARRKAKAAYIKSKATTVSV